MSDAHSSTGVKLSNLFVSYYVIGNCYQSVQNFNPTIIAYLGRIFIDITDEMQNSFQSGWVNLELVSRHEVTRTNVYGLSERISVHCVPSPISSPRGRSDMESTILASIVAAAASQVYVQPPLFHRTTDFALEVHHPRRVVSLWFLSNAEISTLVHSYRVLDSRRLRLCFDIQWWGKVNLCYSPV